ncbi:DHA1 family bicyclomycin/chloramphenicol resistance-like MFS transporter [Ornithinimicrobium humiphilum]|uniref:DHA1 family bicyclomycin/chloramphenicol resistance-like MFS transporter n=1 Tax=Ornithinimicrobium humiphilum TaxID=125288 RepID=A0A543K6Q1_9MICO|nr:multidrug effflux MFS transporter [Ornithinimicrobium humiphilum]TQM90751.1 DHA1 family bicyclomycin/chloramphenicol resistance-like MFS transporter [Ornithinimicrobium humiphilum]
MRARGAPPAWAVTTVVAALAMLGPFTIDTIFPGFVSLGEQFDADAASLQQVTSVYLLSFAAMSVLHGPLSDALGRKPVMLVGLLGYVVASVVCALAPTLGWLLVGRGVQGIFAGAATVVSRAVIRDLYSGARAQRLMSQVMLIFAIAPAMAPIIGGWLLQLGTWPVIFWFVGTYALVVAVAMVLVLPETLDPADRVPLRVGPILAGLWAVARSFTFLRLSVAMVATFGAYIFYVLAAPIIVVDLLGLGEQDFWMLFVPLVGGMAVGSWISGRVAGRVSGPVLVDRTMILVLVAASANVALAALAPRLPWVLVGPTLLGTAIGVAFPVLQLALLDLFPHRLGSAASMSAFAVLISNALLAGVLAPLVTGSLLTAALTSAALSAVGATLWRWHRRAVATPA